jgi:cytochrome c oxidase subunit 2
MSGLERKRIERVLIASANPLFGKGLEKLMLEKWRIQADSIRLTANTADALSLLDAWRPDLVLIDYDDKSISREELMEKFGAGEHPMQIVLISLQTGGQVVVYDRRSLTPDQAQDWLHLSGSTSKHRVKPGE